MTSTRSSCPCSSNRHSSTRSASSENNEKFVPSPSQVCPSGNGSPGQTARLICGHRSRPDGGRGCENRDPRRVPPDDEVGGPPPPSLRTTLPRLRGDGDHRSRRDGPDPPVRPAPSPDRHPHIRRRALLYDG